MTPEFVMSLAYQALKTAMFLAAPPLLVTLAIGLLISIFQAATQINEMTLSFIPKLLGICGVLVLCGPWLMGRVVDYMRELFSAIPGIAQ